MIVAALMMPGMLAVAQPDPTPKPQSVAEKFADSNCRPPSLQGENAARLYLKAWDSVSADTRVLVSNEADERHASGLVEQQPYVQRLLDAAMTETCDWGLDYNGGLETQLPHLGLMRGSARTLAADATRLMKLEGTTEQRAQNERDALRRVQAVFRVSSHVREDRVLISSLVSTAISNRGQTWIEERVRAGSLSAEGAKQALLAMQSVRKDDPFGVRESVAGEWDIFDAWFKNTYGGEDGPKKLAEFIPSLSDNAEHSADAAIAKMSRKEFDAAIARMRDFYMDNVKAWDKPDALEQIRKLATSVGNGEYGPVALRLSAVLEQAWIADDRAQASFAATMKLLEVYIQNGGKLPAEMQKEAAEGVVR